MGERSRLNWARVGGLASLAAGWLTGLAIHGSAAAASGWGDIPDEALLLGIALCVWAGVVAWVAAPKHRRARFGALAGMLMAASFVAGNVLVVALWVDPAHLAEDDPTWLGFLLEAWFAIGVPAAGGLALGALGWSAADLVGRSRRRLTA